MIGRIGSIANVLIVEVKDWTQVAFLVDMIVALTNQLVTEANDFRRHPHFFLEVLNFGEVNTTPARLLFRKRTMPVFALGIGISREAVAFAGLAHH